MCTKHTEYEMSCTCRWRKAQLDSSYIYIFVNTVCSRSLSFGDLFNLVHEVVRACEPLNGMMMRDSIFSLVFLLFVWCSRDARAVWRHSLPSFIYLHSYSMRFVESAINPLRVRMVSAIVSAQWLPNKQTDTHTNIHKEYGQNVRSLINNKINHNFSKQM